MNPMFGAGSKRGYVPQSPDTSEWADRLLFDHWRAMSIVEKAELVRDLCQAQHELSLAGLRARHPEASEEELELMAARLRLGDELFERMLTCDRLVIVTNVDPVTVAVEVARILESLGIPYLVAGSMASTLYGEPRTTLDVDFAAHIDPAQVDPLCAALERTFYVDREGARQAARSGGLFNAIHTGTHVKVDIYARPRTGIHAEEIRRAVRRRLGRGAETELDVATPEDTLIQKLRWYRLGDKASDRQWRDVMGILKTIGPKLDRAYLDRWASSLGLTDLLERAFEEAGLREA